MILPEKLGRMIPLRLTERWFDWRIEGWNVGFIGAELLLVCRHEDTGERWYLYDRVSVETIRDARFNALDYVREQMFERMRRHA